MGCLLNWGLFGTLSVQLCTSLRVILQQIILNSFFQDLYYLAFPNDRRFTKYLVYGIYVIEFVQTMLVAHDVFITFGYGFGDMDALTRVDLYALTVPVMGTIGAQNICGPFSITYQGVSRLCRAGLLCIPNLHIVEVTNHPDIHRLCSLLRYFSSALQLSYLQISLTNFVASIFTAIYGFQAGINANINTRKMHIAVGVCN